jgi:hypothetical protein
MHMESGSISHRSPGRHRHIDAIPSLEQARQKPNPALTAAAHEPPALSSGGHGVTTSSLQ